MASFLHGSHNLFILLHIFSHSLLWWLQWSLNLFEWITSHYNKPDINYSYEECCLKHHRSWYTNLSECLHWPLSTGIRLYIYIYIYIYLSEFEFKLHIYSYSVELTKAIFVIAHFHIVRLSNTKRPNFIWWRICTTSSIQLCTSTTSNTTSWIPSPNWPASISYNTINCI